MKKWFLTAKKDSFCFHSSWLWGKVKYALKAYLEFEVFQRTI